jgi:hypothetical protein
MRLEQTTKESGHVEVAALWTAGLQAHGLVTVCGPPLVAVRAWRNKKK